MKKLLLGAIFLASITTQSFAQAKFQWKEGTSGTFKYKYVTADATKARFYTLSNGLTVILSENKKTPRIQALIGTRAGSNNDPRNHTGLAHYLEHLLFKGTDKFGSLDWIKEKPILDKIDGLYEAYNKISFSDSSARKAKYHEIDSVSGEAAKFAIANEYDKLMAAMGSQGTNAHTWVEETVYQENRAADVHRWIPQGLPYDLIDPIGETSPIVDNVSGFTINQCFNALQPDVVSIPAFRNRLLFQNGNNQQI